MGLLRKAFHAVGVGDGSDGRWAAHMRALWLRAADALTEEGRTEAGAALYRASLHLTIWIEAVPRKNDDKRLAWLRGFEFESLVRTLDRWEASRA